MSNVVPVWNATAGTLAYPAHDSIGAITLDHGQAWNAYQNRAGRYPLAPGFYDSNGDSVVGWNDGMDSRAVKANGWAIVLQDNGTRIAAALAEASEVPSLSQQVAALKQQIATLTTNDPFKAALLQVIADAQKALGAA